MRVPFELAARAYAIKCGKWGWEWRDVPGDLLMHELAIETAEVQGIAMANKSAAHAASSNV